MQRYEARKGSSVPLDRVERKLTAILAADVAGYSRLMGDDEEGTLADLKIYRRELIDPKIAEYRGRLVKTMGDGILVEFASAVEAVRCAIDMQRGIADRNAAEGPERRIQFRVGINVGDVIMDGDDIHGEGVNIAARIEGIAEPGSVYLSDDAFRQVRGKIPAEFADMGERHFKNIARPVRVYRVADRMAPDASHAAGPQLTDKASIVVLPFTNISGDVEQEYFADGLTEDIITELSRITSMAVTARNSAFLYKGRAVDVKQVGAELGARYVLDGSVRRAGQSVRVTAQLIEAATGNHLWAEKYDRELADIFAIQDEITRSVVGSTQTQVVLSEGSLAEKGARPDFRTWDLAKRGWKQIYGLTHEGIQAALEIGTELVQIDPSFAKGHQLLSAAAYHLALMGFSDEREKLLREAMLSAQQAIRLDDADEFSHWLLGGILGQGLGLHDKAISAYHRALELNPNFILAFGSLGSVFALAGQPDESIKNLQICIRSNPRDPSIFFRFSGLALAYFVARDYDKAREWAEKTVARKREWWRGHALLAASCAFLGRVDEAHSAVGELQSGFPRARLGNRRLFRSSIQRTRSGSLRVFDWPGSRINAAASRLSSASGTSATSPIP
jgi:adenylate cyclase